MIKRLNAYSLRKWGERLGNRHLLMIGQRLVVLGPNHLTPRAS